MASFNSASSAFPRQAVVASATLPPQAPVPSFFGNTGNTVPSTTTVMPPPPPSLATTPPPSLATTPPADSFTATAPAPVDQTLPVETPPTETPKDSTALATNTPTAPDPADAKKAEAAKKENGFVKFAKSPWGIGTGVLLAGGAVTALIWKLRQGGSPLEQLEKVVKDLGIDDLDPEHKNNLLQKFGEHLQGLTANTTEHTPETWGKLSSAIVDVHAKHGGHGDGQIALLHGLGESTPENLKDLSVEARKALVNTSNEYLEWVKKEPLKEGDETNFHAPLVGKAAEWLLDIEENVGIKHEGGLVKTAENIFGALNKVDRKGEHSPELNRSMMAFSLPNEQFPVAKEGHTIPPFDPTQISDAKTAGEQLFNARFSGDPEKIKAVLDHLNKNGIEGFEPNSFKDLEERLLPNVEVDNPTTDKRPAWYQWSGDINDSFFWKICKEAIGRFKNSGTP